MTYDDLDINARINLKAILQQWGQYAVERFQTSLDKQVYNLRTGRGGVQRSSLGSRYRFGRGRSGNLKKSWWQSQPGGDRVVIEFLQYGRFLDMGVGRGVGVTARMVNRQLRLGSTGRVRKPWYAKTKGNQLHRLREILASTYTNIPLAMLENALSLTVDIPL